MCKTLLKSPKSKQNVVKKRNNSKNSHIAFTLKAKQNIYITAAAVLCVGISKAYQSRVVCMLTIELSGL